MNNKDKIILILFVSFLILGSLFLYWISSQGAKCLVSPYTFTYKMINPSPLYCSCDLKNGQSFIFNSTLGYFSDGIKINLLK